MNFRCVAIDTAIADRFRRSRIDDSGNRLIGRTADKDTGFFCRHCLGQPGKGGEVLLGNYHVQKPKGAYWSPSPIFVHADADKCPRFVQESEIPRAVRDLGVVGLRAYDSEDMMLYDLTVLTRGTDVERGIAKCLEDPRTSYVNIHSDSPGCFLCRVERISNY